MCVDERYNKHFDNMIKQKEYSSKIIEIKFNKLLVMTKKGHQDYKNFTKYWICRKACEEIEVKVKNHDHIIGKYRRSAHR